MNQESVESEKNTSGISCLVHMPMTWSEKHDAPRPGETLHMQNLQRLLAIEALDAGSVRKTESPSGPEIELQRLETKLNLALDLLGTLLDQTVPRPEARPMLLTSYTVSWHTAHPPKADTRGRLGLYLHPLLAQPVVFPCRVSAVGEKNDSGEYAVSCDLDPLPDDTADAYIAYVFRGHRRAVAEQRLQSQSENTDNTPSLD